MSTASPPRLPHPRAARGPRPEFFEDGSSDTLLAMNVALLTELMVTRERLDTLERLVAAKGLLRREEIDAFEPDEAAEREREQVRDTMSRHVFYLLLQQAERAVRQAPPGPDTGDGAAG
ncbi:MAG: hypothetical protein MUF07_07800 [Steroidobacteraceae bacterium]|jgi:hypothetical protein|nr:hypothetical protein [Steroidobacteraceae bacterium]